VKTTGFIKSKALIPWIESIREKYRVFLPVQDTEEARIDFMDYDDFLKLGSKEKKERHIINFSEKTQLSPKKVFLPLTEKLFDFEYIKDTKDPNNVSTDITITEPDKKDLPILLFGAKPCDIDGLKCLDIFYGEGQKKDAYYLDKRKTSILVSIGCNRPFPDCFCTSVDGHPFNFENADIGLVETDEGFTIVKIGEKAKKVIDESKRFISSNPPDKDFEEVIDSFVQESEQKLKEHWKGIEKSEISKIMDRSMDTGLWDRITAKCISCGACTYVCPTCFCFNIRDEQKGLKGERYRCWDYCMNSHYTLEASGHNPRNEKSKRYRNKANCKYNYNIKRSNNYYCVGCGRCIEVCPVSLDIREVIDFIIETDKKTPIE